MPHLIFSRICRFFNLRIKVNELLVQLSLTKREEDPVAAMARVDSFLGSTMGRQGVKLFHDYYYG